MQKNGHPLSTTIVGLMAKYWQPGRVKTRLGASIGMEQAANLHQLFVHHLLCELGIPETGQGRGEDQNGTEEQHWALHWALSPPETIDQCRQHLTDWNLDNVKIADQGDGDLGDRMGRWFNQCSQPPENPGYTKAILIGSDCPLLNRRDIADAFERLDHFDGVLGPAADGGYYLIGFRYPLRHDIQRIFSDIVWSRDDVFDVTQQRIEEIGMTVSTLPTHEDIDTLSELNRLRQSLSDPHGKQNETIKKLRADIERVLESSDMESSDMESSDEA